MNVDEQIRISDTLICKNIDTINEENIGLASQNILNSLRTFVEAIAVKTYGKEDYSFKIFEKEALPYIKGNHKYKFLYVFHQKLQVSESHYIQDEENSKRLMIEYYSYLLKIRKILKEEYNINILQNLEKFPIQQNKSLQEYYVKISNILEVPDTYNKFEPNFSSTYYIWNVKPFFVNGETYYEIMFSQAQDYVSKFDKIIAFTKEEILPNYASKFKISKNTIDLFGKKISILIAYNFQVSIRPCEINNLGKIFGFNISINRDTNEYKKLMNLMTGTGYNLLDIVSFSEENYQKLKNYIEDGSKTQHIINILTKSRALIKDKKSGSNIIRYLLYNLHNKIIKKQFMNISNNNLSGLYLRNQCIPFDKLPFCSSLYNHNPLLRDLLNCIDLNDREHEFLARTLQNKNDDIGELYVNIDELQNFSNIDSLIEKFNGMLYNNTNQQGRRIERYKDFIYRKSNEENIIKIIDIVKGLENKGIDNYSTMIDQRLKTVQQTDKKVDDVNKQNILKNIFLNSSIALIYGSAGTGKTTLIKHISDLFENQNKLFLANTNPAVNNLRRRINAKNSDTAKFSTISSCDINECDILILDECSTISNDNILSVLQRIKFKILVLVGDIFQIESITFGNRFNIIQYYIPNSSYTLTKPYRTDNENLIKLWDSIREINKTKQGKNDAFERTLAYSKPFDDSLFHKTNDDEIILCLNYDGVYGINNINGILQGNNQNNPIQRGTHSYKIGDPILFNENNRFSPLIYNNLKGKIINIEVIEDQIFFSIEIEKEITSLNILFKYPGLEILNESSNGKTKIRFYVKKLENGEDDEASDEYIVPFQVSYAVSIHKAQGLEYDSVKIIISDEIGERISHNIFYTAITRARKNLAIYRSNKSQKEIIDNLIAKDCLRDVSILNNKFGSKQ